MTAGIPNGPVVYVLIAQPRPTGLVRQLMLMLAGAAQLGVRPHLFCIVRSGEEARSLREAADARGLPCDVLTERGALDPVPLRAFLARVRAERPAAIQTHGYKPSAYGVLARLRHGVPWIAFYHGRTTTDWKVRAYHWLDRRLMSLASAIVAVAPGVESHFGRWDRHRVDVVPNGIVPLPEPKRSREAVRAELGVGPDERLVGFVGRLSHEKGPDVFLRTVAGLAESGWPCRAAVVGDGPLREQLQELARELGLSDRVTFTGHVDHVADLYAAMDLLLISSRSEVFPNVLLEAVEAGVPVASTPVGGIPVIAADLPSVAVARSVDPGFLAEAVGEAMTASVPEALDASRRRLLELYSQEARVEALLAVYREVLGAEDAPPGASEPRAGAEDPGLSR